MIPVRVNAPLPTITRVFPGLPSDHSLHDQLCPACDGQLGDAGPVALVYIGPGDDAETLEKARLGRWHTGAAVAVHAACAGMDPAAEEIQP